MNDWGFKMGSEGNPHVFLGLKREKVKCNDIQIKMQEDLYQHYLKYNMLEQVNQCKANIEQMQCFVADRTLFDLQQELSKYKYYFDGSDEFKAWKDTDLDITDFKVKALRKTFNNDFTFLRQCYADITEPFFIWLESIQHTKTDLIKNFDEFESLFNEFIESSYSNLDSIEGFFGFGPYHTSMWNNYEYDKHDTGGKVFQNNHWNDEFKEKRQDKYEKIKDKLKDKILPRIPQDSEDKQYLIFSKDFTLTTMRPLKTFQEDFSEILDISEAEYKKIVMIILFQAILSSDSIRKNVAIFGDEKNIFKDYKLIGNSCVDFVLDKIGQVRELDGWDKTTIFPKSVLNVAKKHITNKPLSKGDKISYLLQDVHLFYQNYDNLCKLDSTWDSEKGLEAFTIHYANLTTLDNYIFPLTFKKEHINMLGDIEILEKNQAPFAFDKEILNVSLEYANYQQTCSINGDTPIACDDFKLYIKQDDLARRVNTGIYSK